MVIGINSIAAYLLAHTVTYFIISTFSIYFGLVYLLLFGDASLIKGLIIFLDDFLILYWMYKKRLFIKNSRRSNTLLMMKNICLLLSLLFFFVIAKSQENYEIQVYGSQTQQKHSTIFELHSNFTFKGEKEIVKGVRPTYHSLHETIEITHGIGENFEIGAYLFTNYSQQYGFQIVGTHIRPRVMAPLRWRLPVGLSLSAEIGYQRPEYASETWNIELRPIIDKQLNKLYLSFNPTFGIALKSAEESAIPVFEPNVKAAYSFFKNYSLGFEYYGSLGAVNSFESLAGQNHAVFGSLDLMNNKKWEFNAGAGFGLTPATDGFLFKIIVGRRIFWKNKS